MGKLERPLANAKTKTGKTPLFLDACVPFPDNSPSPSTFRPARTAGRTAADPSAYLITILLLRVPDMATIFDRPRQVCLAVPWPCAGVPAQGDELQYLPNGTMVLYSVDLAAIFKSKVYQEVKPKAAFVDDEIHKGLREQIGIDSANVARFTAGAASFGSKDEREYAIMVFTTIKPVTAAEIKAAKKPRQSGKTSSSPSRRSANTRSMRRATRSNSTRTSNPSTKGRRSAWSKTRSCSTGK